MPTLNDIHIDKPMTQISIAYRPTNFAITQMPAVNVEKESDKYFIYSQADWMRNEADLIPDGGVGPEINYSVSAGSYLCLPYGATTWVSDRERRNSDNPLQPDIDASIFVTDKALLKAEIIMKTAVFTATSWIAAHRKTLVGTEQWDDFAGSTPIADVNTAKQTIETKIGKNGEEFTVIMGRTVFYALQTHPDIQDFMAATERKVVTTDLLAQAFGVKKVLAPAVSYNSAAEGATAVYSNVWDDKVWIGYIPDAPSLRTPAGFYIMSFNPSGLPTLPGTLFTFVERVRQDRNNGHLNNRDGFRGSVNMTCEITSDVAGYLLSDVLST